MPPILDTYATPASASPTVGTIQGAWGFKTKVLLAIGNRMTAVGNSTRAIHCLGFAKDLTSTGEYHVGGYMDHDAILGIADQKGGVGNSGFSVHDGVSLDQSSLHTDFECDQWEYINIDSFGNNLVAYMLLGGSDLQVASGDLTMNTSTGDQSVTGVGFQPDCVLFFLGNNSFGWNDDTGETGMCFSIGAATGSGEQWVTAFRGQANNANQRYSFGKTGACMMQLTNSPSTGAIDLEAALTSLDSDGFTFNVSNAGRPCKVAWLALKNPAGGFYAGSETQKTSTGTKATSGVGFEPDAVLTAGLTHPSSSTYSDCVGFTGLATVDAAYTIAFAGLWNTNQTGRHWQEKVAYLASYDAGTVYGAADLASFDGDGFTLDWTTSDGVGREFYYLAIKGSESIDIDCLNRRPQIYRLVIFDGGQAQLGQAQGGLTLESGGYLLLEDGSGIIIREE